MVDPTLLSGDPSGGDIWAPASGGLGTAVGSGAPDSDFRSQVMMALLNEGIDVTRVQPDQLDQLIMTLWSSPRVQDEFGLFQDPSQFGADFSDVAISQAKLDSLIRKELFDPNQSDSSAALQMGISLRELQGLPLTSAQQNYAGGSSGRIPAPFAMSAVTGYGYGYGDPDADFGSGFHEGVDYDMDEGTPLYSPFAGTISARQEGGYGNIVTVNLDNGYQFRMGHMSAFAVTDGQRVDPGELLGLSGNTGNSTGPHVHVEWRDPSGNSVDPKSVLDPIFKGSSFRNLNMSTAAGIGPSDSQAILSKYPEAASMFRKYYGRAPNAREILPLIGMNPQQLAQYFRNRPSQVAGLSFGAYDDLRSTADSAAREMFGHGVTDGMLAEMHAQGKTDPKSVQFYLSQMDIAGKMPKDTYQAIAGANVPHMKAVYNQPHNFDPRIAAQQRQRAHDLGMTDEAIAAFHSYRAGERESLLDIGGGGGDALDQP